MHSSLRDVHDTLAEMQEKGASDMLVLNSQLDQVQTQVSENQVQTLVLVSEQANEMKCMHAEMKCLHAEISRLQSQVSELETMLKYRTNVKFLSLVANEFDSTTQLVKWFAGDSSFRPGEKASSLSRHRIFSLDTSAELKVLKPGTYLVNYRLSQPFLQPTLYTSLLVNSIIVAAASTAPPISGGGKTSGSLLQYVNQITEVLELNENDILSVKCGSKDGKGSILSDPIKNRLTIILLDEAI